ncbi:type I-F CRISPR-associated endoribonuclease Cas6/Csy4 [Methyloprofundus sp.]|uniref:type I-F CRISPR-associated endoribonuclease Cas6/Csy4 n=1 Tax=Methyloprofundus sp. TaxID=2020875 RepID=UPI003D13522A
MDFYIDLVLQADEEVPIYFIRNKVFTKFHKVLNNLKQNSIGVSFPKYKSKLGNVVRIHGNKSSLDTLQQINWLGGLAGYCQVSSILPVPENIQGYRTVSRIRQNMSNSKLQRLINRGSIAGGKIKIYEAKMLSTGLDNPYLELQSVSNGHKHRRYIQFGKLNSHTVKGEFDQFGLSKTATIPWF